MFGNFKNSNTADHLQPAWAYSWFQNPVHRSELSINSSLLYDIPALNVIEHDSIGAGDVFSTAYTIRFFETKDPVISAKFANIAAALSVRSSRFSSIPSRVDVEKFIWLDYSDSYG